MIQRWRQLCKWRDLFVLLSQYPWRWVVRKWNQLSLFWTVYICRKDYIRMLPLYRGRTKRPDCIQWVFLHQAFAYFVGTSSMGMIYERFGFIKAPSNKRQGFMQKVLFSFRIPAPPSILLPSERHGLELRNWVDDSEKPIPLSETTQNRISWLALIRDSGLAEKNNHFQLFWAFFRGRI